MKPIKKERLVEDGFGNSELMCWRPDCDLQVVRPGKFQCRGEFDRHGCPDSEVWWREFTESVNS